MSRKKRPDDERPPHSEGHRYNKNSKPLSPVERLEKINDALLVNELLESEFDASNAARADQVIRAAAKEALEGQGSRGHKENNQGSWSEDAAKKRTERERNRQRD